MKLCVTLIGEDVGDLVRKLRWLTGDMESDLARGVFDADYNCRGSSDNTDHDFDFWFADSNSLFEFGISSAER